MYPARQTFFVLGLSKSGSAATEFLLKRGATVFIYDDVLNDRIEEAMRRLEEQGAKRVDKSHVSKMVETCDALVLSPGIPIDHPLAVAFKRNGRAVIGESELAARYMCCPIIAVTGTNGKTTTVSMLEKILSDGGIKAQACGNVGFPMINCVDFSNEEVAIAEVSSFQLETLGSLCPHIAVVLNVTEDHLNRHYNMENYIFLKAKILKNSTEAELAVLNYDDPTVRSFSEKTKARIIWFSAREEVNGACVKEGWISFAGEKIMPVNKLSVGGAHNVLNALAAVCAAKLMGVKTEEIARSLAEFKGVRHRVEYVDEVDGVKYINDSKGTNVDATLKAIGCMKEKTVLLLGGKDKGYDYDKLFSALRVSSVVSTVLYGENRFRLLDSAIRCGYFKLSLCSNFSCALQIAKLTASAGQTVLLSPASASFDEFDGFEERGDAFVSFVRELAAEADRRKEESAKEREENLEESEDGEALSVGDDPSEPTADGAGNIPLRKDEDGEE